jgi:Bacterial pre-peptidase C-terminal domain
MPPTATATRLKKILANDVQDLDQQRLDDAISSDEQPAIFSAFSTLRPISGPIPVVKSAAAAAPTLVLNPPSLSAATLVSQSAIVVGAAVVAVAPPDLAGNTPALARPITLGATAQTFNDFVGPADAFDYYSFTTTGPTNFQLLLNGLTADANVQLLAADGTTVLQSSSLTGTSPETINNTLPAGSYFVRVVPVAAAATNYALSMSAAPIVSAGMHINLIWDASVTSLSAPVQAAFKTAVQSAASMLQAAFTDNITINISVGWGESGGTAIASGSIFSSSTTGQFLSYGTVRGALSSPSHDLSADDNTAAASLTASLNPNGTGQIAVWRAQEKALGLNGVLPNDSVSDGNIGFSTASLSGNWVGNALNALTYAMGRVSGTSPYGILDLFRYSAATGTRPATPVGGTAAYFSIDGGATRIADFSTVQNVGDWLNDSLTPIDPFDSPITASTNALTTADLREMDTIGFSRVGAPVLPQDLAGNTLAAARQVTLAATQTFFSDFVGPLDPLDYYTFTTTGPTSFQLGLSGLTADANVTLLAADGIQALGSSALVGTSPEAISVVDLTAGTYFVRVVPVSTAATNYTLAMSGTPLLPANVPGNSSATARAVTLGTTAQTFTDFVGPTDPFDWYKFTTSSPTNIQLLLSAGATASLRAADGQTELGGGNALSIADLTAGTYFVFVQDVPGFNFLPGTNYALTMSAVSVGPPDFAGNTTATARKVTLGATAQTFSDFVNTLDPLDYYTFTTTGPTSFQLGLSGLTADANVTLLAADGIQILGTGALAGISPEAISVVDLTAGTYFVRVVPVSTAATNYSLALSAAALAPANVPGNSTLTARAVTLGSAAQTFNDFVGPTDFTEFYKFTTTSPTNFQLLANGLAANAVVSLLDAANGFTTVQAGNSISVADLSAGSYFVVVQAGQLLDPVSGGTIILPSNYALTMSAVSVGPPDFAGNTPAAARSVTLGATTQTFSDFVNSLDPVDYYTFTTAGPTSFQLGLSGLTADANVTLLAADGATVLSSSALAGTSTEAISVVDLTAGTYFVRVTPVLTAATNYTLALSTAPLAPASVPGGTPPTAQIVTLSPITQTFSDSVSAANSNDYYRFTTTGPTDFQLVLNGLTANVDVQLLGGDGATVLRQGILAGITPEALRVTSLPAGTYFVRVAPGASNTGTITSYNLAMSAAPVQQTVGMNISFTLNQSVLSLGATTVALINLALASVSRFFHDNFANTVNMNVAVDWGSVQGASPDFLSPNGNNAAGSLISSDHPVIQVTYDTLRTFLTEEETSVDDVTAVRDLPADPAISFFSNFTLFPLPVYEISAAMQQAWGLNRAGVPIIDPAATLHGAIGFNGFNTLPLNSWDFDPSDGIDQGKYDFVGAAMHEVSELLGRTSDVTASNAGFFTPLDLFRYSPITGLIEHAAGADAEFSIDGTLGPNNLHFSTTPLTDFGDWTSTGINAVLGNATGAAFKGVTGSFSETDLQLMDVIGFGRAIRPPLSNIITSAVPFVGSESVSPGLDAPSLSFIGHPDLLTFGGSAIVGSGTLDDHSVEIVSNFVLGTDELRIALDGMPAAFLRMSDTTVNAAHAVSMYDSRDPSHGIVLTSLPSSVTAFTLQSHVSFSSDLAILF